MWRPMIYCYMTDKFQETYEEMFSALSGKCKCPLSTFQLSKGLKISQPQLVLKYLYFYNAGYMHMNDLEFRENFKMISDWEVAERQAFSLCFDLLLLGCLFHLGM